MSEEFKESEQGQKPEEIRPESERSFGVERILTIDGRRNICVPVRIHEKTDDKEAALEITWLDEEGNELGGMSVELSRITKIELPK